MEAKSITLLFPVACIGFCTCVWLGFHGFPAILVGTLVGISPGIAVYFQGVSRWGWGWLWDALRDVYGEAWGPR